jgi:hypothetical protein
MNGRLHLLAHFKLRFGRLGSLGHTGAKPRIDSGVFQTKYLHATIRIL